MLMFCLGLLATLGHFLFIEALKLLMHLSAPFVYLTVLLAAFWGYILYDEVPQQNTILGFSDYNCRNNYYQIEKIKSLILLIQ